MSGDDSINRAARHFALPQIGQDGQSKIAAGAALVIGVGGLGCAAASYLASSGVGQIIINDFDRVDATNLGRQPLFGPDDVGELKAECAARRLSILNPDIDIISVCERLDADELAAAISAVDVVFDCSDNFATRFAINKACVATATSLVSGAAIRFEGQLAVFGPDFGDSPCYRCLYQEADESLEDCAGNGVFSPVPGVIGTSMASEGLKILAGLKAIAGRLSLFDALASEWRSVAIAKRAGCPECKSTPA